ncbi:MAG TPA: sporulation protein YqfC [Clostridium sp.]|nr:sporulation protein YqfC [Clostridium sp.]
MPEKKRKKRKVEKNKSSIKEKMSEFLELPKEIVLDLSKITMYGNNNVLIENYKGIIEYENDRLRINTKDGIIRVMGNKLFIKEITSEDLLIYGEITSIEFLR